jgi:hypothetical protein
MQHFKDTKKAGEFEKFIDSDSKTGLCLEDTLKFFEIQRIFKQFESIKQGGIDVVLVLTALLVMLFYNGRNIHNFFSRQFGKLAGIKGSKNPYYDLLGNEYICWRSVLYLFVMRYLNLANRLRDNTGQIRALIFDDSPLEKRGKKIEGVSKIHDHVTGRFIFGYKILVCGYWDGGNFIPVDFSLHRERGKELDKARTRRNRARQKFRKARSAWQEHKKRHNKSRGKLNVLRNERENAGRPDVERLENYVARSKKKLSKLRKKMKDAEANLESKEKLVKEKQKTAPLYGLPPSKYRKQYKKYRSEDSPGYQRRKEADQSKSGNVINMLRRVIKRGFVFDYVLFDSWFFSKEILECIESFHSKCIKLIAMIKMNKTLYKDCLDNQEGKASELRKKYRKKSKRSRKFNATYIKVPVWYGNRRLNMFFIRIGSGTKWKCMVTNDLNLSFNKLMEIYHIRWSIEVFFKDAKQYLQLGKCQCNNFDSQIGAATLCMMQYIMLLLYKQMHYGQSLGSIFDMLGTQAQQENISRYLLELFWDVILRIGKILKVDCFELFEEILSDNQRADEIIELFSPVLEKKRAA